MPCDVLFIAKIWTCLYKIMISYHTCFHSLFHRICASGYQNKEKGKCPVECWLAYQNAGKSIETVLKALRLCDCAALNYYDPSGSGDYQCFVSAIWSLADQCCILVMKQKRVLYYIFVGKLSEKDQDIIHVAPTCCHSHMIFTLLLPIGVNDK